MIHALKTIVEYFEAVQEESKTFEVRKNDRPFEPGDFLALNEFHQGQYTGRCMVVRITYILDHQTYCKDGYVVLGIHPCGIRQKGGFDVDNHINHGSSGIPVYGRTVPYKAK